MKLLNLKILAALFCMGILFTACNKNDNDDAQQTITIGGLLSLTGNWSTLGATSQAAMAIANEDINNYLISINSKYRLATEIFDTKLQTDLATQAMASAKGKGIKYVIGPQSSAEIGAIKPFADANKMIVISQGSTAGAYAIAHDNIYRFCPSDVLEGPAIANTIYKEGKKGIITLARDDAGNKGLQLSVSTAFKALGGQSTDIAPYAITTTDFTAVIADLKTKINAYTALYGTAGTAVYYASFDEFVELFKQAASDPVLASVNWYGGDAVVLSTAIIGDAAACGFAAATHFFAPTFGLPVHPDPKWEALAANIKARTGIDADAFALATYDAMWVIANTVVSASAVESDFDKLKAVFELKANSYYGVTGSTLLNEFGDRSIGTYDYWGIVNEAGQYKWKLVGRSE